MLPDEYFTIKIASEGSQQTVRVQHKGSGAQREASCQSDCVGRTKHQLKSEIIRAVLGAESDMQLSTGRGSAGDVVFAEHMPTGTRTDVYLRSELVHADQFLLNELLVLVSRRAP